jgi:competence protein ComEA
MFGLDRRQQILLFLILGALLFGGGIRYALHLHNGGGESMVVESSQQGLPAEEEPGTIFVHVIGAVQKPGIYELPVKSRVFEAVEKAVPLPEAELQALNLAKLLRDEEKVIVPWAGEAAGDSSNSAQTPGLNPGSGSNPGTIGSGSAAGISSRENEKLDLNTASAQELDDRLPGIGPTLAQRIIEYRQQHGAFRSIEDLQNVAGIGEKRFDQLKDYITVNP